MTIHNENPQSDNAFGDIVDDLERLAAALDAEHYPGQAWSTPRPQVARLAAWKIVAALAAAAAVLVAVMQRWPHHQNPASAVAQNPQTVAPPAVTAPMPPVVEVAEESTPPQMVMVEDLDSYSIIESAGGVTLVSFGTKDSSEPPSVVPVLLHSPDAPLPKTARDKST